MVFALEHAMPHIAVRREAWYTEVRSLPYEVKETEIYELRRQLQFSLMNLIE